MEGAIYLIVSKRVGGWSRIIAEMELASFSHLTETGNTSLGQCCSGVAGVAARGCNASFNLFRIMRSSMLPYPSSTEPWVALGRDWWRRKSEAAQHNNHYNWMQPVSPLDASLCRILTEKLFNSLRLTILLLNRSWLCIVVLLYWCLLIQQVMHGIITSKDIL